MSVDVSKGKEALDKKDYQSAVNYFSAALKFSQAPAWLLQRSIAYHRLSNYDLALTDANNALLIAIDRGKRELIAEAHYRRGIILHGLKQYGNSRLCFNWCRIYNEKQPGLTMWAAKVKTDYDASGGEQAECNTITVKEIPDKVEQPDENTLSPDVKEDEISQNNISEETNSSSANICSQSTSKIRHEWYQSQNTVTVEILAKGISKDKINVDIQERSLEINFPIDFSHSTCNFTFEPLFSSIDKTKSFFRVTPHKIEITLQKLCPGLKWTTLQISETVSDIESSKPSNETNVDSSKSKQMSHAPMYPTSSKNGPKNWDTAFVDEPDDENTDGPDAFFKMLYKNADLDTKRAMMKSYQESNGTSLSTQWSDVANRKFETVPPEGVEAKRWDA